MANFLEAQDVGSSSDPQSSDTQGHHWGRPPYRISSTGLMLPRRPPGIVQKDENKPFRTVRFRVSQIAQIRIRPEDKYAQESVSSSDRQSKPTKDHPRGVARCRSKSTRVMLARRPSSRPTQKSGPRSKEKGLERVFEGTLPARWRPKWTERERPDFPSGP